MLNYSVTKKATLTIYPHLNLDLDFIIFNHHHHHLYDYYYCCQLRQYIFVVDLLFPSFLLSARRFYFSRSSALVCLSIAAATMRFNAPLTSVVLSSLALASASEETKTADIEKPTFTVRSLCLLSYIMTCFIVIE